MVKEGRNRLSITGTEKGVLSIDRPTAQSRTLLVISMIMLLLVSLLISVMVRAASSTTDISASAPVEATVVKVHNLRGHQNAGDIQKLFVPDPIHLPTMEMTSVSDLPLAAEPSPSSTVKPPTRTVKTTTRTTSQPTILATSPPTMVRTATPTMIPSYKPTTVPTSPSTRVLMPSRKPTRKPNQMPTKAPAMVPSTILTSVKSKTVRVLNQHFASPPIISPDQYYFFNKTFPLPNWSASESTSSSLYLVPRSFFPTFPISGQAQTLVALVSTDNHLSISQSLALTRGVYSIEFYTYWDGAVPMTSQIKASINGASLTTSLSQAKHRHFADNVDTSSIHEDRNLDVVKDGQEILGDHGSLNHQLYTVDGDTNRANTPASSTHWFLNSFSVRIETSGVYPLTFKFANMADSIDDSTLAYLTGVNVKETTSQ